LDFKFYFSKDQNQYWSHNNDYIIPYNSNKIVDSASLAYPIPIGDTIDSNNNWGAGGTFYSYSYLTSGSSQTNGIWPYNANDYFVGLRLVVDSTIYYGWVRKNYYTIKDYAYESSQNYIVAGEVPIATGVPKNTNDIMAIGIFPNPSSSLLNITGLTISASAEIYSLSGKILLNRMLNTQTIDISPLAKGLYFIKLRTEEGSVVRKFVKE
jgi:hypothetical protein